MHKNNWDGYDAFHQKIFQPKRQELKSRLQSVKNRRLKKATVPFFISVCGIFLWALSEWMSIDIIPFFAGDQNDKYWLLIIAFGIMSVYFYFSGDEENQTDAELMDLIMGFRGWESHYKPGKEFSLKPFNDSLHLFKALLDGNIGFLLSSEETQDSIKTDLSHHFVLDKTDLFSVKCNVEFTEHIGDEVQNSDSKIYFEGVFMKIPVTEKSDRRFAVCPGNKFNLVNTFNTDKLSAEINLPIESHYASSDSPYVVFSDGENSLIDPLMESIKQQQKKFIPVNTTYVYCDGKHFFLGLDYKKSLFDLNLRDSDEDVETFKSHLDFFSDWANQLAQL